MEFNIQNQKKNIEKIMERKKVQKTATFSGFDELKVIKNSIYFKEIFCCITI